MSNIGDPLALSVEKDINASPTKGKGSELSAVNDISEDAQNNVVAGSKTNASLEPTTRKNSSTTVVRSPTNLSKPYSRSSSPAEENYETFRSPINDSRGYYASAIRRRELSSISPPRDRRVAPRLNSSPSYAPRNLLSATSAGAYRAASDSYNGRGQDDMDIGEQSPRRIPPPRFPAYENSLSGSNSSEPVAPRGRTTQRKSPGGRKHHSQSDSYARVDEEMDLYDDEDDEDAHGSREDYTPQSQSMQPSHYREPQGFGTYRREEDIEDQQAGLYAKRGNGSQASRFRARGPVENVEEDFPDRRMGRAPFLHRPAENEEDFGQCRESHNGAFRLPGEPLVNDGEDSLFISDMNTQRNVRMQEVGTGSGGRGGRSRQLFSHDTFLNDTPGRSSASVSKKRKATEQGGPRFNQPGASLAPSRYSGDPSLTWGLNQDPPSVPQTSVSDAALLKRNLTRGAKDKVCKRGYGANDPENVNIVNMKEDGMSFAEIVEQLNNVRVANGRAPSLSVCGVTSRYNRTAPLLFAAEGRQFIPLSKRGKGEVLADGPLAEKPLWNDELDLILAQCVKDIEKEKWGRVAKEYNRRTGKNITAAAAALRHTLL
ncbi:hypothetical protein BKA65DRAFT_152078 [Rhexocercosporidium sp. MPI-PUGE-AT-0058]|nr:hypothetical protein BKA65DRAFT_152078 [Rhexocercosporidium sp. MPI-PUGE-AT-0058]